MANLPNYMILFLFAASILAGFVNSIAGGSLIGMPALLIASIPPIAAIGANKITSICGVATAIYSDAKKGHVNLKHQGPMALMAGLGGILGAACISFLPETIFKTALPFVLIAVALYFYVKKSATDLDKAERISPMIFGATIVPLIGFYDGIFGPGASSFYMLAFVSLAGYGLLKATAHTKLLNFASNFGAFIFFLLSGALLWKLDLIMGLEQIIGTQFGARLAMKNGAKLIKPLLVIICIAMAIKLLSETDQPLWQLIS